MQIIPLPNNITVSFHDLTRRYFGDFHHVKIKISCEVPVDNSMFSSSGEYAEASKLLGTHVTYTKVMEKMGVPTGELTAVRNALLNFFENHAISYLSLPSFPARLVKAELKKRLAMPPCIVTYRK